MSVNYGTDQFTRVPGVENFIESEVRISPDESEKYMEAYLKQRWAERSKMIDRSKPRDGPSGVKLRAGVDTVESMYRSGSEFVAGEDLAGRPEFASS